MTPGLFIAILVVLGVALGVHFYVKLLRLLRWKHRSLYEELGRPALMMASLDRSIRLQSFIYSREALQTGDGELSSTIRFLRIFSVLLVVGATAASIALVGKAIGF